MRVPHTLPLPVLAVLTVALFASGPASAQDRPWSLPDDPTILAGFLAWDRGEYPEALRHYLDALNTSVSPDRLREIAQLTGEIYTTTEVAPDGGDLEMGPDGQFMSFVVDEDGEPVTKIVSVSSGQVVATLEGSGAAISAEGEVAYLAAGMGAETVRARQVLSERIQNAADRNARFEAMGELRALEAQAAQIHILDLSTGADRTVDLPGGKLALVWGNDGTEDVLLVAGGGDGPAGGGVRNAFTGEAVPGPPGSPTAMRRLGDGRVLAQMSSAPGQSRFAILSARGEAPIMLGDVDNLTVSADGSRGAMLTRGDAGAARIETLALSPSGARRVVFETAAPMSNPVISPDGDWVAFQMTEVDDWNIYAVSATGSEPLQITTDIQHDRNPMWVGDRILSAKGEGRHQRSYLNEVADASERIPPLKLHHNNSVRTIAPEYEWVATPDGSMVFLVSERDGDTVSPERGVYRVDLTRVVSEQALRDRITTALAAEEDLRARGAAAFAPMADVIRQATERIATERVYAYAADLYRFGSKNITEPGNLMAIDYLVETLRGFGYEPILEWWEPRPGVRTTNVVLRIEGMANPELVYVVSSHFDSSARGPGADDNTSGSTALLEVARVLAGEPLPATIELAWFTGEESGLLGSRYYVQRAQETGKRIVGALNNDMVGWANDHRLDNTIRYSNPGIRDIQHAAAMMFSDLITYDALYYKSTDAAAYYEAYGDIVGGIGSYPVLANPHYHQFTDRLETINHQLVAEVAKTTAATIMLLAASPSRIADVQARVASGATEVTWSASPEAGVTGYRVAWTDADGSARSVDVEAGAGATVSASIPSLPAGATVSVKAVDRSGTVGWDWGRGVVGG